MFFLLCAVVCLQAAAQFVKQPTGFTTATGFGGVNVRYKEIPTGLCETEANVKTIAGYVDVSDYQHFYFLFFEARHSDPSTAPLTIWTDGGPGATSIDSAVSTLGPCTVQEDGSVLSNPLSWNNISNVLFIDQPISVGYSYSRVHPGYIDPTSSAVIQLPSEECPAYAAATGTCGTYSEWNVTTTANSTTAAAVDFYQILQGFLGVFPRYGQNGVNIVTESYGGHYGVVFSRHIVEQNAKSENKIDLRSLLIGNGWFDPSPGYSAFYNYTVSPGNPYDWHPYNKSTKAQLYNSLYGPGNCQDQLADCARTGNDGVCASADQFCANTVQYLMDLVTGRDEEDVRELSPDPFPTSYADVFFNDPKIQQYFGAFQNFSYQSYLVGGDGDVVTAGTFGSTGDDARDFSTVETLRMLMDNNVSVVLYNGDADYICNIYETQATADAVDHPHYASAGWANISVPRIGVQGQVKQADLFSFVRVYWAGHYVPFYQPELTLAFLNRTIHRKDIATGAVSINNYTSSGTKTSDFREGKSTFQYKVLPDDATYDTRRKIGKDLRKYGVDLRQSFQNHCIGASL